MVLVLVLLQVHVHLRCAGNRQDGHGPRGDALSAARGRHGRDPAVPLRGDQRDEDDGSSSGVRSDPAGERGVRSEPQHLAVRFQLFLRSGLFESSHEINLLLVLLRKHALFKVEVYFSFPELTVSVTFTVWSNLFLLHFGSFAIHRLDQKLN